MYAVWTNTFLRDIIKKTEYPVRFPEKNCLFRVKGGFFMQRNDASIVALFWERKEEALTEARTAYGVYCTAVAESILHNSFDAEECVSDAFLAAWDSIPPNRPEKLKFLPRAHRPERGAEPRGAASRGKTGRRGLSAAVIRAYGRYP